MKIKLSVEKEVPLNLALSEGAEELLGLWYEHSSCDEGFLHVFAFVNWAESVIGAEHIKEAIGAINKIQSKIDQLKKEGFTIDLYNSIEIC